MLRDGAPESLIHPGTEDDCSHCGRGVRFTSGDQGTDITHLGQTNKKRNGLHVAVALYTARCPSCGEFTVDLLRYGEHPSGGGAIHDPFREERLFPVLGANLQAPEEVPERIAQDFERAIRVAPVSGEAAAALFRRALEAVLGDLGYKGKLEKRINEAELDQALGVATAEVLHAVREVGNYAAHPDEVLWVETGELIHLHEVLRLLFEDVYIRPARMEAAQRGIEKKLAAAGRDPTAWRAHLAKLAEQRASKQK